MFGSDPNSIGHVEYSIHTLDDYAGTFRFVYNGSHTVNVLWESPDDPPREIDVWSPVHPYTTNDDFRERCHEWTRENYPEEF